MFVTFFALLTCFNFKVHFFTSMGLLEYELLASK